MLNKVKKISSLLLLVVFLAPTITKLEHHHEEEGFKTQHETHIYKHHENCAVCDFEFQLLFSAEKHFKQVTNFIAGNYKINYKSGNYQLQSDYLFLLRAPPYKLD